MVAETSTAIEYLKGLGCLPVVLQRGVGREIYGRPSNSELVRWLNNGSVRINGKTPKAIDEVTFPIRQLIFFENSKHRVTILEDMRYRGSWQRMTTGQRERIVALMEW